jgi:hypothetical protein
VFGAGGTGKTQTFESLQRNFMIAGAGRCVTIAPTGIASMNAKRRSIPGVLSCTLQSFCNAVFRVDLSSHTLAPDVEWFVHNDDVNEAQMAENPRQEFYKSIAELCVADRVLVLVDESSMVSLSHAEALMRALRRMKCAAIVFAGDNCQLPPISFGAVFRDIIAALPTAACTQLKRQYRQKNNSALTRATLGLRDADILVPRPNIPGDDSFVSEIAGTTAKHGAEKIIHQLRAWGASVENMTFWPSVMVICTRNTFVNVVNAAALHAFAPVPSHDACTCRDPRGTCAHSVVWTYDNTSKRARPHLWPGVRVMCTKNMHELEIYNGLRGVVTHVSLTGGKGEGSEEHTGTFIKDAMSVYEIRVRWDTGDTTTISYDCIFKKDNDKHVSKWCIAFTAKCKVLNYAYALTVHKAQSTEADSVIYMQDTAQCFLHRKQAYTALSRSKHKFVVFTVSAPGVDSVTPWINAPPERQTLLKEALITALDDDDDETRIVVGGKRRRELDF